MAEMYGKQEGCCRGRGGSMHVFDRATRFYGGNAIVGGGLPLAVGIALGDKMLGRDSVTACFFGDGAVDEGAFHESLNLAALWKLPVLFVCENNLYAMGMALERAEADTDIAHKAAGYHMPGEAVDGMDVVAVEVAARRAVGAGPRDRRAVSAGMPHLPLPRPLDVRRAALPRARRDRAVAPARSDPADAGLARRDRHAARRARSSHRGGGRARRSTPRSPSPRPAPWKPSRIWNGSPSWIGCRNEPVSRRGATAAHHLPRGLQAGASAPPSWRTRASS